MLVLSSLYLVLGLVQLLIPGAMGLGLILVSVGQCVGPGCTGLVCVSAGMGYFLVVINTSLTFVLVLACVNLGFDPFSMCVGLSLL